MALSAVLPRAFQYAVAGLVARVYYLAAPAKRRAVQANLRVVLGKDADESLIKRCARGAFASFSQYICEFFGARRFGPAFLRRHVIVNGQENLDEALAGGHGALFVSGHYSNWELGAFVVGGQLGYPIMALVQSHANERVNRLFVSQRERHGVTVVDHITGLRQILRGLRDNRPVAILADRPTGGPTLTVTMFGRPTAVPQGPWRLAVDTGAPILPTFVHRRSNNDYTLTIGRAMPVPGRETGSRGERMQRLAQAWVHHMETRILEDPCQWAAFYPVWGTPQAGVESGPGLALKASRPAATHVDARTQEGPERE